MLVRDEGSQIEKEKCGLCWSVEDMKKLCNKWKAVKGIYMKLGIRFGIWSTNRYSLGGE